MKPEEKAKQLIETAKEYVHGYVGSSMLSNYEYPDQVLNQAKKMALVILNEILYEVKNGIQLDWTPVRRDGEDFVEYWSKVEKSIKETILDK